MFQPMKERTVITRYEALGESRGLRAALVTDLHNCDHTDLLELLREESPDLILCAGDILERNDPGASVWTEKGIDAVIASIGKQTLRKKMMWVLDRITERNGEPTHRAEDIAIEFLKALPSIAPTFYSVGNHEWYFTDGDRQIFDEYGITLLDNADCEAEIKGNWLRIGGLSTRYDLDWLREYSRKDGYKILMCHHPEYYRKAIQNTELDSFGLVVSGHYHGGQWRILNRSVYVPRTGLFMKSAAGQYGKLIISAGTSNTSRFSRFGNPCELVMIKI